MYHVANDLQANEFFLQIPPRSSNSQMNLHGRFSMGKEVNEFLVRVNEYTSILNDIEIFKRKMTLSLK